MERRLTAIMAADVVGYSRLIRADEEGTLSALRSLRADLVDPKLKEYKGRIVKLMGDGMLAEFVSVMDALRAAVETQQALAEYNSDIPKDKRIEFRVGINLGDVVIDGDDIYGDGVNIAARLEGLADAGGICVSGKVYEEVRDRTDLAFEDMGEKEVKNIDRPVQVWRWISDESVATGDIASDKERLPLPDKPSIAVLPFANLSDNSEERYFSDGITEDIITSLSRLSSFFVIARNSSFVYRDATDIRKVGRDLGVGFVIEGAVRRAAGRVRITAQLIDAVSGYHLWADRYDRDLDDIFAVQDDVTDRIIEALQSRLERRPEARPGRQAPKSFEAYDHVLRAIEASLHFTEEANTEARDLCERAIALDPEYAEAYARLANTYIQEWNQGWNRHLEDTLDRAQRLAQKAAELNDDLALAHATLEHAYLWMKEHDRAIVAGKRALLLDPNNSDALAFHAMTLSWASRPEEALPVIERAISLNPHHPHWYHFVHGLAFFEVQRLEDAVLALRRGVARVPEFMPNHFYLAVAYVEQSRISEARAEAADVFRLNPDMTLKSAERLLPYRDPGRLEHCLNRLQRAGLPQ